MISKNSIGGGGLLLFLVVVSQARLFDFLIDTSLGRMFLILVLVCLSYCHGVLGVVGVLLIIIAYNNSGLSFLSEGFETSTTSTSDETATTGGTGETVKAEIKLNPEAIAAIQAKMQTKMKEKAESAKEEKESGASTDDTTTTTESRAPRKRGLEGFDILGLENSLKRGKQSNTIPTSSYSKQDSDFISAYEGGSSIFGNFSLF